MARRPLVRNPRVWASFCLVLAILLPSATSFVVAQHDTCACGMRNGCYCKLVAAKGAHCEMGRGQCSIKPAHVPATDPSVLLTILDVRGWLWSGPACGAEVEREPSGSVVVAGFRAPRFLPPLPEIPPPRPFQLV